MKLVIFMGRLAHVKLDIEVRRAMYWFYWELWIERLHSVEWMFWRSHVRAVRRTGCFWHFSFEPWGRGWGMTSLSLRICACAYPTSRKAMGSRGSPVAAVSSGYPGQNTQREERGLPSPSLRGPDGAGPDRIGLSCIEAERSGPHGIG